jgi:hypothetical protein
MDKKKVIAKVKEKLASIDNDVCLILSKKEEDKILAEMDESAVEASEYRGRKVKLNKPMRGDVKKYKVYVKNDKGNVVKVNFGDKNMEIRRDDPKARKNFRSRHKCENPGPKWKPRYWSCRFWSTPSVSDILKG